MDQAPPQNSLHQGTALNRLPRLVITMGDPAGIGPEVTLKALREKELRGLGHIIIIGDPSILDRVRKTITDAPPLFICSDLEFDYDFDRVGYPVLPITELGNNAPVYGKPNRAGDLAQIKYVLTALEAAKANKIDGIITGPITKGALAVSNLPFRGHTELLASSSGSRQHAMLLAGETLRVALVTTHIPLAEVPAAITKKAIIDILILFDDNLKRGFALPNPRIAVTGLNPHCGENGLFGKEDQAIILPAIHSCCQRGINATGPIPADTAFLRASRGEFDGVLGMYHDQALIPIKLLHFGEAVNVTLGLDFVRTSVDHGVAYDIAGMGKANPGSMISAIRLASKFARPSSISSSLSATARILK